MPVSPAQAEHLAAGVVAHYQDAEAALVARIARNLGKGLDAPEWAATKLAQMQEYERQAKRLLADLEEKAARGVATAITDAYEQGGLSAVADLSKLQMSAAMKYSAVQWSPMPRNPWEIREPDGRVLHKFDTAEKAQAFVDKHPAYMGAAPAVEPLAGLRAIEALTQETLGNVLATHTGILRSTMDTYRSVIAESSSGVLLGDQTRRQAAQAALNRFAQKGITGFVDSAGRGWSMESYTEMAMRTGCGRAAVQGHVDRLTANGLDLVIVSDAPRECPLCRPWEGKVLSIGGVPVEMPPDADAAFQVATEGPGVEAAPPMPVEMPTVSVNVIGKRGAGLTETVRGASDLLQSRGIDSVRRFDITSAPFTGNLKKLSPAMYDSSYKRVIVNPSASFWSKGGSEAAARALAQNESGFWSTGRADHPLIHELGHAAHDKTNPEQYAKLYLSRYGTSYETMLKRVGPEISRRAAADPLEFVAETFVGLIDGRSYSPEAMRLYAELGGLTP